MGTSTVRRSVTNVSGQRLHLRAGVINDAAKAAFTQGHCATLALALHQRTGWPLKVLVQDGNHWMGLSDDPDVRRAADRGEQIPFHYLAQLWAHVYVQRPDGLLVDVTGPHTVDTAVARYQGANHDDCDLWAAEGRHRVVSAAAEQVASLTSCAPPSAGVAELFVDAVLALDAGPEQPWPWHGTLRAHLVTELDAARDEAAGDAGDYLERATELLESLDEDYHLLHEAVVRGMLPTDLVEVARGILTCQPVPA